MVWSKGFREAKLRKNSKKTLLTTIVLTLISKEDLEMKKAGHSDGEIMEIKIAKLFKEAYEQAPYFYRYCEQTNQSIYGKNREILPTRGVVHDIGGQLLIRELFSTCIERGIRLQILRE